MLNLLNTNNYVSVNITLAKMFGLEAAIYCSELLNIYDKAKRKDRLVNGDSFKVDREYIEKRTTVSIDKQLEIDSIWQQINLVIKDKDNQDVIKIDTQLVANLIAGTNTSIQPVTINVPLPTSVSTQEKFEYIKSQIKADDPDILQALKDWVDSAKTHEKGKNIELVAVRIFQKNLNEYAKDDKELKLKLLEIAILHKHISFQWTINEYEKNYAKTKPEKSKSEKPKSESTKANKSFGKMKF
jgi:hypothetical protein